MSTQATAPANNIQEPGILTANTYFWSPGRDSGSRRRAEDRNRNAVADFFRAIGMDVTIDSDDVVGRKDDIVARFSYSESCSNVYKHLSITRNGKVSNIKSLRKLYAK